MSLSKPEILTFSEMIQKVHSEPVIPVVERLLNLEEFIILSAAAKTGKTLFAFDMAACIAKGESFLGVFQCNKHKVLFIQSEVSNPMLAKRIEKRITDTKDPDLNENIIFCSSPIKLDERDGYKQLEDLIQYHKPQVVIIDSFYKHHSKKEDSASDMGSLLGRISDLKKKHKIAIFITHHQGKRNEGSGNQQAGHKHRGSSAFGDVPDGSISMERGSHDGINKLKFEMRNIESPKDMEIQRQDNLSWLATGNNIIDEKSKCTPEDIQEIIMNSPDINKKILKQKIAEEYGVRDRAADERIRLALNLNLIKSIKVKNEVKYQLVNNTQTRNLLGECADADTMH